MKRGGGGEADEKTKKKSMERTGGKVDQTVGCCFLGLGVAPKFFGLEPPLPMMNKCQLK